MSYTLLHNLFPELAEEETRSIRVFNESEFGLPAWTYGFLESYCDEKNCDCRRVFFLVVSPRSREPLAVIAYGWEKRAFYTRWLSVPSKSAVDELCGPTLTRLSRQSKLAPALLELCKNVLLKDPEYVARIKRHYRMFRDRIDGRTVRVPCGKEAEKRLRWGC
ncbi:MAG: hypothetical protein C4547_13135 [Phycisphaerales bacterium]|nr:MAG: hypothetical protein C4547_13135 [Phycisphaerales bacterium]